MTEFDSLSDCSIASAGNSDNVWREGDLIVIDRSRGDRLPPICPLSGETASRIVHCLFHKQRGLLAGGATPVEALLDGIRHYFQDVDKLKLAIPMADKLHRRWWMGWCLAGLATLSAVVTILGLWYGQVWVNQLPAGPDKQFWRDLGIPLVALGGFALIAVFALISYRIMPMVTQRLQVVDIVEETIWLRGACSEYLAALPERPSTLPDE